MIITLCRRGLLKIYASFCELNISFYKTLTFRFADYTIMTKGGHNRRPASVIY